MRTSNLIFRLVSPTETISPSEKREHRREAMRARAEEILTNAKARLGTGHEEPMTSDPPQPPVP